MNFVTFVFSLLLIFAFGTFVVLEKQSGDRRLRETYLGHVLANRKILSEWESKTYHSFRSIPKETDKKEHTQERKPKQEDAPEINPSCARLNLWPLVQEGREKHPLLYDMALKLLDSFYGMTLFKNKPQEKGLFLNAFLKKAQDAIQKNRFSLEKLSIDPTFQASYYKMLKGTKTWKPKEEIGYPSLLDVIKVDESASKVCLCHAHQGQIMALFGKDAGKLLYDEIHKEDGPVPTKELVEELFAKSHKTAPNEEFFDLLEMGRQRHLERGKTTFIASDDASGITLRKNIYTPKRAS